MAKYISKRILIMIPTILFVVFIIFYILHFMPSSPGRIILGVNAKEADVQAINDKLGYNDPVLVQYINYVKNALTLNFGESYQYSKPVFQVLLPKFPVTLNLAFLSSSICDWNSCRNCVGSEKIFSGRYGIHCDSHAFFLNSIVFLWCVDDPSVFLETEVASI